MKSRTFPFVYFAWLIVPFSLWLIYQIWGLPHILWSYRWVSHGTKATYYDERYKTECDFIGPYGVYTVAAHQGSCGWIVRLFKKKEAR